MMEVIHQEIGMIIQGKRWANIVVTDGTIENGQITGATKTTYFCMDTKICI